MGGHLPSDGGRTASSPALLFLPCLLQGFGKKKFKGTVASVSEVEGTQIFKIE
jgi:hypothetical protein